MSANRRMLPALPESSTPAGRSIGRALSAVCAAAFGFCTWGALLAFLRGGNPFGPAVGATLLFFLAPLPVFLFGVSRRLERGSVDGALWPMAFAPVASTASFLVALMIAMRSGLPVELAMATVGGAWLVPLLPSLVRAIRQAWREA